MCKLYSLHHFCKKIIQFIITFQVLQPLICHKSGVGKVRPAGKIRPSKKFCPARGVAFSTQSCKKLFRKLNFFSCSFEKYGPKGPKTKNGPLTKKNCSPLPQAKLETECLTVYEPTNQSKISIDICCSTYFKMKNLNSIFFQF